MKVPILISRTAVSLGIVALFATSILRADSHLIVVSGFQTPESVVHDPIADLYLVSNVGPGNPGALDHNGFISRVSPEGVILQLKWIQDGVNGATLNGPKGIWLYGNALHVADVDTLRIFDRLSGMPLQNIGISNPFAPSALFLNDVVVTDLGTAYVTDNRNSAIFMVEPDGHASLLASGLQLGSPNGIVAHGANISWVTFSRNEVLRTNPSGQIFTEATLPAVDVSQLGLVPGTLRLDGYVRMLDGSLLVTSWLTGKVVRISPSSKEVETVAQFVSVLANPASPHGPADINVDQQRNRLLVPLFGANQLVIMPIQD
jgi:sugar lactone lactonase YvrE